MRTRLTANRGFVGRRAAAGLSLIELMISIALGLILSLALVQVVTSSKQTFVYEREMSILQENARFAIESLSRDLGGAAFSACRSGISTSVVVNGSGLPANWEYGPLGASGFDDVEDAGGFPADIPAQASTDALVIRGADGGRFYETSTHAGTVVNFPVGSDVTATFSGGDVLLASDSGCEKVSVFQAGTVAATAIDHATATSPGNCSTSISTTDPWRDCSGGAAAGGSFGDGGTVARYKGVAWFVADSALDNTIPALWRRRLINNGGIAQKRDEEILQGVENMQITYGYDTDGATAADGDGIANYFFAANDESVVGVGNWDWERVVSVRVALLLRSIMPTEIDNQAASTFEGLAVGSDRFARHRVVSTIQVKNHGL